MIVTYKHSIQEVASQVAERLKTQDLRINPTTFLPLGGQVAHTRKKKTQDLRELGNIRKVSKPHRMIAQCPAPQAKSPETWRLNSPRGAPLHMKTGACPKYPVTDCLWKPPFDSNSSQTLSNLIPLTLLVTLRPLTLHCFNLGLEQSICKKGQRLPLLDNCFSDLLTDVEIWY